MFELGHLLSKPSTSGERLTQEAVQGKCFLITTFPYVCRMQTRCFAISFNIHEGSASKRYYNDLDRVCSRLIDQ